MKKHFYFIISLLAVLSSCGKTEVDDTPYAAVSIYNASPTVDTYDVYLNDVKANSGALPLGGGFPYQQKVAGSYTAKFTTAGRIESLFTKTIALSQNTYFSYFLLGKPGNFEGLLIPDDISGTSATNAFVRFINLSADAPALDFGVTATTPLTTKTAYKAATGYVSIAAGKYTFDIKDNGGTTVRAKLTDVTLAANAHYTVFCRGLITPATNSEVLFDAQIITNK